MAIRKLSTSSIRNNVWYRSLTAGSVTSILPAEVVRVVNTNRAQAGLGGAFMDAEGSIYFTASNNNGGSDGGQITQKLSSSNSVLWSYTYPNTYGGEVGLRVDASGNIYTGGFHGNGGGNYFLLVVKYSPSGTRLWQRWFGGSVTYPDWSDTNSTGHTAMSGGAFTSGRFALLDTNGNTVFTRSGNLGTEGGEGGYMAGIGQNRVLFGHRRRFNVFNLTGGFQFGKSVGTAVPRGAFDASNNLYLWHSNHSDTVMYVTKFDASGAKQWDRQITAPSGVILNNSQGSVDSTGNSYIPISWYQTSGSDSTLKMVWISFDTSGTLRYQRAADVSGQRDSAGQLNINEATGRGFIAGFMNGTHGGFVSFDLTTGNDVTRSASPGGVTVSYYSPGFTISTPSSLSYSDVGDIGGSTTIDTVDRGSSGGNSQYTISRATFA
jgi:hypothetical protein